MRGDILIFTTTDAHTATYVGLPYVYQFNRISDNCGPCSANAIATAGNVAYWMGRSPSGFFRYDGTVTPLRCDVEAYLVDHVNQAQASKVVAWHNMLYAEIVWFYPGDGVEVDSYVSYNYEEDHWATGSLARTGVSTRGVFAHPILFDSAGNPYEHEVGGVYQDVDGSTITPYLESGPVELGNGDKLLSATRLIPDLKNASGSDPLSDITTTFSTRMYPTDTVTAHGPYTMAAPTSVRFTGRSVVMLVTSNSANSWRLGIPRLELRPAGER